MDFAVALLGILSSLGPVAILFIAISCGLSYYIFKELKQRSEIESDLRDRLEELQKLFNEALLASQQSRVDDLKLLLDKYDKSLNSITDVLKQLGKKGEK
jgi:hypothetical protein